MAKKTQLKAAPRARTGSGPLNQMRREGWLPSVIYGRNTENVNLKVDAKTFVGILNHSSSENLLFNLDIEGQGTRLAFLQAVDHDPLSGEPRHADFLAIDENTPITAHIPVHALGEAAGVKKGGILEQYIHSLEIVCLPNDLPEGVDVDVAALDEGASLHIGELALPTGVKATHAADVVVIHVGKSAAALSEAAETVA